MRFLSFGAEHACGALPRERLGVIRKALDRAAVDYSPDNPQAALAVLPLSDAPSGVRPARPQPFESPLPRATGIAFRTRHFHARTAPAGVPTELIVVSLTDALLLTRAETAGVRALVVVTSVDDAPLADHHRDFLWNSLGLPVFEQLTGWDGTVIARECQAHSGLHVAVDAAIAEVENGELLLTQLTTDAPVLRARTGWSAELLKSLCECGQDSPRVRRMISEGATIRKEQHEPHC